MVEENAIRVEVSPWEQAMVAVRSARAEAHDGIDAAIDALYRNLDRQKRTRLRTIAHLAAELDGFLTAPETFSLRQLLRLAPLIPRDYGDLIRATLEDAADDPEAEWRALLPIMIEAERHEPEGPARPGRPRRTLDISRNLRIRRERTRTGWALHFAGRDATSDTLDSRVLRDRAPVRPGRAPRAPQAPPAAPVQVRRRTRGPGHGRRPAARQRARSGHLKELLEICPPIPGAIQVPGRLPSRSSGGWSLSPSSAAAPRLMIVRCSPSIAMMMASSACDTVRAGS